MKTTAISLIVISLATALVLFLGGCASQEAYQGYLAAQGRASDSYYRAVEKPLLSLELPSPVVGQPYKIEVAREVKPLQVQQIKDSEWVNPASKLIGVAGGVAGAAIAADMVKGVAGSGGGDTYTVQGGGDVRLEGVGNHYQSSSTGAESPATITQELDRTSTDDRSVVDDHAAYGEGDVGK